MLKEIWTVMQKHHRLVLVVLIAVLAMLGTASKLQIARKINLSGAVSGNANFDGNTDIIINTIQSNIAILTGTMAVNVSNGDTEAYGTTQINYPSGYNKDNCVVLSLGIEDISSTLNYYNFGTLATVAEPIALLNVGIGKSITFKVDYMVLKTYFNYTASSAAKTYNYRYKIVLMKV